MITKAFEKAAKEYGGTYTSEHFKTSGQPGSSIPISIHNLVVELHTIPVTFRYELGNTNLATVTVAVPTTKPIANFTLETRSHIARLFRKRRQPWIIKTPSKQVSNQLTALLANAGFTKIAEDTSFEPTIKGTYSKGIYSIFTRFYLGFDHKEEALLPAIRFHQQLITLIQQA